MSTMAGHSWEIRVAAARDVAAITAVVNRAYRPAPGEAGWTHEAHLVAGARTSDAQVEELMTAPGSMLLIGLCCGEVAACIQVEATGGGCYFGMLAVDPLRQGQGLGTRMLEFAEHYATEKLGASRLVMTVVSRRQDLVSFYLRRGYQLTGRVMDYPSYAGIPSEPGLELVELAKQDRRVPDPDRAT
jgi:GNAT superfamily N-acetyltransferase